ncbi:GrpB family protein [Aliiglaciecola lipolytica]|uniref:GrpB family protein n=1 Tax=Aliiglaciecola lipolytica E3 TaxID=1127673 RepID=K6WZ05_9ALTE|nr:GrpB family protein [Aliiglaciecola lipolytica]GAC13684.1 hypothetical protein GLIP_1042 [Aliiglaciecola lipolytica E3]
MYLFPPNSQWQVDFEIEKNALELNFLGEIEIFHVGSTAVKGLWAKDCIDLLGVVKELSKVQILSLNFGNLGYIYKGEYGIQGRAYFTKQYRKAHLHIFQQGDENIEKHLKFVNLMRDNSDLISEFNTLKQELHTRYPKDKASYQNAKAFFYNRINNL